MGFVGWYWKHSSFRPVKQPRPKAAMSTIGGVTHRLRWVDRNAGWRMACSCGWDDQSRRWTQDNAVRAGNQHVRSMQWARVRGTRTANYNATMRPVQPPPVPAPPPPMGVEPLTGAGRRWYDRWLARR